MKNSKYLNIIHIVLALVSLLILMIPWYQLGIDFPSFVAGGKIVIDSKYLVVGFLYIILFLIKFLEQKLSSKKDSKIMISLKQASDKILLNGLLIILAYNGFLSIAIPIIVLMKDSIVDSMKKLSADNGKMMEKGPLGIMEKVTMNLGIILLLFYNLPFELWNIFLADALIMIAVVLGVLNSCIYYFRAKNVLLTKKA